MAGDKSKSKKAGRNALRCKSYKDCNQRERNKIVKLNRHMKRGPNDQSVLPVIEACKKAVKGF